MVLQMSKQNNNNRTDTSHEAFFKKKMHDINRRAKQQGALVDIDWQYLMDIYPEDSTCPILDFVLIPNLKYSCTNSPSVDRIDPHKGYVKGNVIWVSMLVNQIMSEAAPEEVIKVGKFYKKLISKKCSLLDRIKYFFLNFRF